VLAVRSFIVNQAMESLTPTCACIERRQRARVPGAARHERLWQIAPALRRQVVATNRQQRGGNRGKSGANGSPVTPAKK
jgi:hypothetical protein